LKGEKPGHISMRTIIPRTNKHPIFPEGVMGKDKKIAFLAEKAKTHRLVVSL
jgi:hypothetical protein